MTPANAATQRQVAWVSYSDVRSGLVFEYPAEWKVERGMSGLVASAVAPQQQAGLAPNLNLVRRVNDHDYSLDDFARVALREVRRVLTDVALIDLDAAVVSEQPARRLLFSYRQGIYGLTGEQWVWLTRTHLWTVTAGARSEDYDDVANSFARLVRSVRVNG